MGLMRRRRVVVREPTVDDALGIAQVLVKSWHAAYQGLLPDPLLAGLSVLERQQQLEGALQTPAPEGAVRLVAELGGVVVGFANAGATENGAELAVLYVDPDKWRHGVGRRLLRRALVELDDAGFSDVHAWVVDGNEAGFAFFEAQGGVRAAATRHQSLDGHLVHQSRVDIDLGQ